MRFWLVVILASLGFGMIAGCTEPSQPPLRVGTNHWPGYEGLYYARERGLLDAKRIQLLDFSSNQETMRAFRNGALDAVAITLDEALLLLKHKQDPRAILILDISHGGDVLLARPDIARLSELRGRRIGVETNALGSYMLARVLHAAGLRAPDVHIVYLPPDQHAKAYMEGKVDAVITFDPMRTKLVSLGARELFNSRQIPGEIVDVLVARKGQLEQRRADYCHLVKGYFQALQQLQRDPVLASHLLATSSRWESATELQAAWKLMRLADREENLRLLGPSTEGLSPTLDRMQAVMLENRLLDQPVDITAISESGLVTECGR